MLDLPRYLLGVAEIALLAGFATLGASALRSRLLPAFMEAPAHLATAVIALAMLILTAEILGVVGLFESAPYLAAVVIVGLGVWLGVGRGRGHPGPGTRAATLIALVIAALALIQLGFDAKPKLSSGMTGFDSTWYHGPFAAGFFQSGDTWSLHFIAPQFLAWFYPANAEIFHGVGMLAFGRDILSPLLNLGWFVGCLAACWCIGRPYRVAPWSLALGAVALSLPVLSDQAGEARNDIAGIFFLLAAVAIAVNARRESLDLGAVALVALAAGLAAGTKLNFLLPAAVLVLGLPLVVPAGRRWRALGAGGLAALAGGGYWYLRNLVHSGNPLPWLDSIGPISLPAPEQALGGREGHSVLGYLTDGTVWADWFLPGLRDGLTLLWPLVAAGAVAGLLLCLVSGRRFSAGRSSFEPHIDPNLNRDRVLPIAGLAGIAVIAAWLIAPTSASGPEGMPRGFESNLRYLSPALVLGLAILPAVPPLRRFFGRTASTSLHFPAHIAGKGRLVGHGGIAWLAAVVLLLAVVVGYPVQRHYLDGRYANPSFAAPGLNAAFAWATPISNARIATTSTRQYPLYGTDLSNHVQYVGEEQPHGGFTAPTTCRSWRRLLNAGNYDYVVASHDRIEPNKPPYPPTTAWTEGPTAEPILRKPPTVVFKLKGPLDPSACPSR